MVIHSEFVTEDIYNVMKGARNPPWRHHLTPLFDLRVAPDAALDRVEEDGGLRAVCVRSGRGVDDARGDGGMCV